jgi:hypothetical protein
MSRAEDMWIEVCQECWDGTFCLHEDEYHLKCNNQDCGNEIERYVPYAREPNTPILQLLKEYEMTNIVDTDEERLETLVQVAVRLVDTMEDEYIRCLLWKMARQIDEEYKLGLIHPNYK